jgi:lipopolysaccharide export system protein LptA
MHRIRLLRILVPILLLGFLIVIALTLRARPRARGGAAPDPSADQSARMEGFRFSDLVGGRRRLLVQAKVGRVDEQGAFEVEQVERFEVDRENQAPLLLTATRGAGSGAQGKRTVRLEGGVTLRDDESGLGLEIPTVEIDQVTGIVRSIGTVALKSEAWSGSADEVIYSLKGEPTQMRTLVLDGPAGGHLSAQRASMRVGSRTLTLGGQVEASQRGMSLRAEDVVLVRRADGGLESAIASPAVTGTAAQLAGGSAGFVAREVRALWGEGGQLESVTLSGSARIQHPRGNIAADTIEAKAIDASGSYAVSATGQVDASAPSPKGPSKLTCDALRATLDAQGMARDGLANGNVRFEGEGTSGEAADAAFAGNVAGGTVTLRASGDRRARLASGRMRVAAQTIVSDVHGSKLTAEGRVESTMLPAPRNQPSGMSAMFTATEAVHFVSASLESDDGGTRLVLRGDVRAWQGERSLAADEVEMIREGEVMNARGRVATRMPRDAARAATEADYIQVGADRLSYRGGAHTAEYDGAVRVRQAEGWLNAPRLIVTLASGGPGLREVQALDGIRFEYRAPGERGVPTTATGEGDRGVYDATTRVLRVFGDKAPATIRSTGANGGTTVGRVLRYELESGALEVESGERDRATIQTPKK